MSVFRLEAKLWLRRPQQRAVSDHHAELFVCDFLLNGFLKKLHLAKFARLLRDDGSPTTQNDTTRNGGDLKL
jgi:hypothetical protein